MRLPSTTMWYRTMFFGDGPVIIMYGCLFSRFIAFINGSPTLIQKKEPKRVQNCGEKCALRNEPVITFEKTTIFSIASSKLKRFGAVLRPLWRSGRTLSSMRNCSTSSSKPVDKSSWPCTSKTILTFPLYSSHKLRKTSGFVSKRKSKSNKI